MFRQIGTRAALGFAQTGTFGLRRYLRRALCRHGMLLGCALLLLSGVSFAGEEEKGSVSFRWAFGAVMGSGNDRRFEPITHDTALNSGDQLKMLVELQKECFVYIIHRNPDDRVALLFPYGIKEGETHYQTATRYYIPRGDAWFELDRNVGRETFYLLASDKKLCPLEELISRYETTEAAQKPIVAKLIFAEIQNLKKQHRQLASTAERPVIIGGRIRGIEKQLGETLPDIATIADEISGVDFYARTFTIEHR
jgi:hypothetical protein